MRVAIASRIFEPEPSAASVRLAALATALRDAGHEVSVYTTHPTQGLRAEAQRHDEEAPYTVKRFPVARDRQGYVRGYVPYLSFDLPLFLRLIASRFDVVVCEPPPTTGCVVRVVSALRRVPYVYYAADVWSDAAGQTGASSMIVRTVRALERAAWKGASLLLSVSEGVTRRLKVLGVSTPVHTIGNGVNTDPYDGVSHGEFEQNTHKDFVYAGTASEWHGADIFIRALPKVLQIVPETRLRFIGGGSQKALLESLAEEMNVSQAVSFEPLMQPVDLAPILSQASAAVASVRPDAGYDFAFPTKLYSAAACGAPLIYVGPGPAVDFVEQSVFDQPLGIAARATVEETVEAMIAYAQAPFNANRRSAVATWAVDALHVDRVARRAVERIEEVVAG